MIRACLNVRVLLQYRLTDSDSSTACSVSKYRGQQGARSGGPGAEVSRPPRYEVHDSAQLPRDVQISAFLRKGETKTFFYWSNMTDAPLSVTVTACSSTIRWSVIFREKNDTSSVNASEQLLDSVSTRNLHTLHLTASKGQYVVQLESVDGDSYTGVYVSTEPGGPQPLQITQPPKLRLQNRQRRKQLAVRWNQSLVDPHVTNYCLVISQKRNYSSLCEALEDRFGIFPPEVNLPDLIKPKTKSLEKENIWDKSKGSKKDPMINCVGSQTQYTLNNLEHGKVYHFNLFATNLQSNLSYPYGSAVLRFDSHVKPTALKDGKAAFVNLKKLDGKAVFRYKVGRASTEPLKLYVIPCGGAVDVEVTLKSTSVEQRRRVDGYGKIFIKNPIRGQRYYIRVITTNREELKRTSGVEVLATTRPSVKFPLPNMPSEVQVYEYASLRRCDSVTVGWLPSPDQRAAHYCLVVREGRLREMEGYRMPNQCGLESRLKKSADFAVKYCQDIKKGEKEVITQKISQLKTGRSYVVQVTIKKPKGKTLSYDLLQVHTKPSCEKSNL
ncbi:nord [Carabus blaptoides fortunei]